MRVPGGVERTRNRGTRSSPDTSRYVGDLDDGPCRAVINRGAPGWGRSCVLTAIQGTDTSVRGSRGAPRPPVRRTVELARAGARPARGRTGRGEPELPVPRARRRCALDAGRGALIHTLIHDRSEARPSPRNGYGARARGLSPISTFRRRGSCAFTLRSQPARNSLTSSARAHGSGCPATSPWRCAPPRGPLPVPFPQLAQPWRGAA